MVIQSSEDEVADDAGKKSTKVLRKKNGVQDPAKEGDKNNQENDVRDQEKAPRKKFKQESKRLFGQREATNTNSTNILNTVSSLVNVDVQSAAESTYVYLSGSISINAATLPNADLPTDPLMPDLEDTADTGIFSDAYDNEVEHEEADFNNLELITVTSSTLIETNKALLKDEEAVDVDVHLYRLMIGSLIYLTASRPDIIYLKDQPELGLWSPRDSPFDLESFLDSDYVGASLDRKSTT
nr:hypothetical protein [Tanacetum cinerariifolium]